MCKCARLVLSRAHKNGRVAARSYALLLYTLCAAEGLAWLLSLLYSIRLVNGQSTQVTPMSHSLEEVCTTASYRMQDQGESKDLHSIP